MRGLSGPSDTRDTASDAGVTYALRALRHRDFRIFWTGALASNTGTWLTNLSVPYALFQLTHSAMWVSLATVAQIVPGVLLGPVGGSLADHYDRRKVLIATQAGMAAGAIGLCAVWASGSPTPWLMMLALGVTGVFSGTNLPVWQSFTNDLVPRSDLSSAIALNSIQFNAARALGPALAGAIIALLSPGWAFGLDALSFVAVQVALMSIRSRPRSSTAGGRGVLGDFRSAVRYVAGQRGIQVAILLSILVGMFGNPIFTFTVVFADDVFHVGAIGLGLMNAAMGVGCLLAAPLVSGGLRGLTLGRLTRIGLPVYGLALGGFALCPGIIPGVLLLVLVGACFMSVITSANTAIQLIVATPMRGRVIAVRTVLFTGTMPLGSLLQGALADAYGPRLAMSVAGLGLLAAGVLLSGADRGRWLRRLDDPHDEGGRVPHSGTIRPLALP